MERAEQFEIGFTVRERGTRRDGKVIAIEKPFVVVRFPDEVERMLPKEIRHIESAST